MEFYYNIKFIEFLFYIFKECHQVNLFYLTIILIYAKNVLIKIIEKKL
jgi:hypothetical protein